MKFYLLRNIQIAILVIALVFTAQISNAQQSNIQGFSSMKVGQMSDQQIMQIWQQAQKSGMSETEAMNLLVRKGLNPTEVNGFKKRLVQLQSSNKSKFTSQNTIKDTTEFMRESSWIVEVPMQRKQSVNYGFEFFSNPGNSFEPNLRIATPKNYILGPDDELSISLTGLNEANIDAKISPEGNIQIPYAGIVNLNGLSIEQATQKIKNKMKNVYPALASGKTSLFISLGNIKSIRVSVIGEAERPGNYLVSALASFFNVLYLSGGPSSNGSLRKIELIRNNKVIETIDFYSFLQKGILNKEIRLEDQDVIRFPIYEKRVYISGEIKRPAIYELLSKETLTDLIQYGGGLGDSATKDVAKIVQIGDKEKKIKDIASNDYSNYIPHNADSVFFEKILPRYGNRIVLTGAVYRPGNYELTDHLSLAQLIKKADGLRDDAFANRGYIKRKKNDAEREFISFDTKEIMAGNQTDISLVREDSVFILAKDSLQDIPVITIAGSVRTPGSFQYRKGLALEDVILLAGGFTNDAANHKIEISRLEKNKADTLANKLIDILRVDVDADLHQQKNKTLLQPLDYIFVPRLLNYHTLGNIQIRGEVLYAGDYTLERRDETVQEVIKRAGGITPYASMGDVQVYRKGLRVGTTLLAEGSKQTEKFLLQPDDSIYIPRNEPFVEVKGAVFNPQILSYEPASFRSYINNVGGVTDKGNLKKAYIQYSNGISKKSRHFLFFGSYPKVLPGSKITVPEKTGAEKKGLSLVEISAFTAILTALVSLANILKL
jgi:protein involved in polysaccharide export with SLBB domain